MTRPNILWICTDQQRWDTIGGLGFPAAQTPHLDALAGQGTAFSRAYCQSPICTPSRASFLTGMYPIAHQVQRNGNVGFPEHLVLVPEIFRQAGYRTGLIGKLHLSAAQGRIEQRPTKDGYEEFYWSQHPEPDWPEGHDYHDWLVDKGVDAVKAYATDGDIVTHPVLAEHSQTGWATEKALNFIDRAEDDRPWMLSLNIYDPHPPFDPPQSWFDRFDPLQMPMPVFAHSDLRHHRKLDRVDQQTRNPVDPNLTSQTTQLGSYSHDTPPDNYDIRRIRAAYMAMIAQIDDMVGQLMTRLEQTNQRRSTLVLFMSDHGEMLGDHGLLYKGCRFYEGLVHVPMIFSLPGLVQQGVVSDALVELVDIPATICEAAGLEKAASDQGRSLMPLLTGAGDAEHHKDYVLCEYMDALRFPGSVGSRGSMYFDGRYKICVYHDTAQGELFDLVTDQNELQDLWDCADHATLKADLLLKHFSAMMMVSGAGPRRITDY